MNQLDLISLSSGNLIWLDPSTGLLMFDSGDPNNPGLMLFNQCTIDQLTSLSSEGILIDFQYNNESLMDLLIESLLGYPVSLEYQDYNSNIDWNLVNTDKGNIIHSGESNGLLYPRFPEIDGGYKTSGIMTMWNRINISGLPQQLNSGITTLIQSISSITSYDELIDSNYISDYISFNSLTKDTATEIRIHDRPSYELENYKIRENYEGVKYINNISQYDKNVYYVPVVTFRLKDRLIKPGDIVEIHIKYSTTSSEFAILQESEDPSETPEDVTYQESEVTYGELVEAHDTAQFSVDSEFKAISTSEKFIIYGDPESIVIYPSDSNIQEYYITSLIKLV